MFLLSAACVVMLALLAQSTSAQGGFINGYNVAPISSLTTTYPYATDDDDQNLSPSDRSTSDDDFRMPLIDSINGAPSLMTPPIAYTLLAVYGVVIVAL